MKAFLLAAGLGSRLRPITDSIPKCLVPIKDKPLLQWWLELFAEHNITDVLINTHYLAEPVRIFIEEWNSGNNMPHVTEFYEEALLGSGGTVAANQVFVGEDDSFMICYADNLTDVNLTAFQQFHKEHSGILTMGLFYTNLPKQCGIAALDEENRIVEFVEKPEAPKSNLANAGIYIARREIFDYLPIRGDGTLLDFGKDVLPQLVGNMYGWQIDGYLLDIGTIENYNKAKREWCK